MRCVARWGGTPLGFSWYQVVGLCGGLEQGGDSVGGVGIVHEELLGGFTSLSQAHVLPAEPCAALLDDARLICLTISS